MTPANIVTILRLSLIPIFTLLAVSYANTRLAGTTNETLRYAALATFIAAAAGDGLDGYLARKYGTSRLGAILDPLCDKVLMLAGLITLSIVSWGDDNWKIPMWYVAIVICRDVSISLGCGFILMTGRKLQINTSWTGKATTVAQLFTLGWVMLKIVPFSPTIPTVIAAVLTLLSSWLYVREAFSQLEPS